MLDLHCHILPGVDDGPVTLDDALELARFSAADGITHITATPHCHSFTRTLRADVLPRVERLNDALRQAGIALTILPGSEIQLLDPAAYRRDYEAGVLCHLGDRPEFTLVEFPWNATQVHRDAPSVIRWLRDRGVRPILAHPERHDYFRNDPDLLDAVVSAGAWVQVTVDSLLGNFGPLALRAGEGVLRTYPDAVLATDAHNRQRCSGLAAGYAWVRRHLGPEREADLRARSAAILERLLADAAG